LKPISTVSLGLSAMLSATKTLFVTVTVRWFS
jgi:hypothetical protein